MAVNGHTPQRHIQTLPAIRSGVERSLYGKRYVRPPDHRYERDNIEGRKNLSAEFLSGCNSFKFFLLHVYFSA